MDSHENTKPEYFVKGNRSICAYITASILLILVFLISPLNNSYIVNIGVKITIFSILCYTLWRNYVITRDFTRDTNTSFLRGEWSSQKSNVACSYILSIFILLLIVTVVWN